MEDLGKMIGVFLMSEAYSKRKAARNNLSSQKGSSTWGEATDLENESGLGLSPNEDAAESSFGSFSENLKKMQ